MNQQLSLLWVLLLKICVLLIHDTDSTYVTNVVCSFESGDLCGWKNISQGGTGYIMLTNDANDYSVFPMKDSYPGKTNGSYFFYQRQGAFASDFTILRYPRQQYISEISFDYYIYGITLISVNKIDGTDSHPDVVSWTGNNATGKWENISVNFKVESFSHDFGINIVSSNVEDILGEAVAEIDSTICIDRLTVQYTLPCNFDALSTQGNLILSDHTVLNIPLGEVTNVSFTASSAICPNGPFVYYIKSNNQPVLNEIFSINETTGILTIDATGSSTLVPSGVDAGKLVIAVYVKDSDYLDTGEYAERTSLFIYKQDPTITVQSPNAIEVQVGVNFTYEIMAISELGVPLEYSNIETEPEFLVEVLSLEGTSVKGLITSTDLLNIIEKGKQPLFSIDVSDSLSGSITLEVQLEMPATPPTFDKDEYVMEVKENHPESDDIGNFTVGDINENKCLDINVTLVTNGYANHFSIVSVGDVYDTDQLCLFYVIVQGTFNYETKHVYQLSVIATDSSSQSTVVMITVNVLSVNEFPPRFDNDNIQVQADYNSEVGKLIYLITASDKDSGPAGELSYDIISGNDIGNFKLEQLTNEQVELQSASAGLVPGVYDLTIQVSDGQEPVHKNTMTITVVVNQGYINCSIDVFGPPQVSLVIPISLQIASGDDVILQCGHTSFPPSYPVIWYTLSLGLFNVNTSISHNDPHYVYSGSNLTVLNVTNENLLYWCNVTNPCGSSYSAHIYLDVIELPNSINDLTVSQEGSSIDGDLYVELVWTSPPVSSDHPIDGYMVFVRQNMDTEYILHSTLENNVRKTRLTGLKPGTNHTVMVKPYNLAGDVQSNVVTFMTETSAPRLSVFDAVMLANHSIRIEWSLAYDGGSEVTQMSIDIKPHLISKKRSTEDDSLMVFDVTVDQGILITPALPYGRSYRISATIENIYGSTTHIVTTFVGFQDIMKCSFTTTSSCSWLLSETGRLQSGVSSVQDQPESDATGISTGSYVIGQVTSLDTSQPILYHHDITYLCGYQFYYQTYDDVRLILMSSSQIWNETVHWISSESDNVLDWKAVEVPAGDMPISSTPQDIIFMVESFDEASSASFVAVDEVSLYFCLPCNYSALNNDSFLISGPSSYTIYMRSFQRLVIETELNECMNPLFNYAIKEVIPSYLQSAISIPNPREGVIEIADVTPYMATVGTEGNIMVTIEVPGANYKGDGTVLHRTLTIPFTVSERFENCSYVKSCDFEDGPCDWTLSDQSSVVADSTGDKYISAISSAQMTNIIQTFINDSYCGINFLYSAQQPVSGGYTLQVSVDGVGILWSSDDNTIITNSSWREVSLYIDIMGVQMMPSGRTVSVDMILDNDDIEAVVRLDNITLHPCVDCEARECSCISCIQQCSSDPCQPGYYLSLEINQCRACPKGYYCTSWRSLPNPCPPGTFVNTTGAHTLQDCLVCPAGTYSTGSGTVTCTGCPSGHYCEGDGGQPIQCPVGTYYNKTNGQSDDVCQVCPDGFYSIRPGVGYCEDCPSGYDCPEAGKLPVSHINNFSSSYLPTIIGVVAGCLLLLLLVILIGMYFICKLKITEVKKKKQEKSLYKRNFLRGLDQEQTFEGSGPKTGTVRTAPMILALNDDRFKHEAIQNHGFDENSDSSSEDAELVKENNSHILPPLGQFTNTGTVSSLKSLDSTRDWKNVNPLSQSESQSNMSVLIELDDELDHVWSALKKKKENEMNAKSETNV